MGPTEHVIYDIRIVSYSTFKFKNFIKENRLDVQFNNCACFKYNIVSILSIY